MSSAIEIAPTKNYEPANLLKAVGDAYEFYGPFDARRDNGHGDVARSCDDGNFGDLSLHGFHVAERNLVTQGETRLELLERVMPA